MHVPSLLSGISLCPQWIKTRVTIDMSSVGNFDLRYNLSDISDDDGLKVNDNTTEKRYLPPVEEVSSPKLFLHNFLHH